MVVLYIVLVVVRNLFNFLSSDTLSILIRNMYCISLNLLRLSISRSPLSSFIILIIFRDRMIMFGFYFRVNNKVIIIVICPWFMTSDTDNVCESPTFETCVTLTYFSRNKWCWPHYYYNYICAYWTGTSEYLNHYTGYCYSSIYRVCCVGNN